MLNRVKNKFCQNILQIAHNCIISQNFLGGTYFQIPPPSASKRTATISLFLYETRKILVLAIHVLKIKAHFGCYSTVANLYIYQFLEF